MKDLLPPAPKAYGGPSWQAIIEVGEVLVFGGKGWRVMKVENRGRVIHWECNDGRKARTECMPTHPHYPPDPTPEQLRAESHARIEAKKAWRRW